MKMKHRIIFSFLTLLTAVLLFGCTSADNNIPADDNVPNVPSLAERLVGKYYGYVSGDTDEPDTYLDIYYINGFLIAEAKETYAAYWAMEMTPLDETDFSGILSDTMEVTALYYSGFSNFGEYWPETEIYTLHITESGVDFLSADGSTVSYIRSDTLEAQHDPERYRDTLIGESNTDYPDLLTGEWFGVTTDGTAVYLHVESGGIIRCLSKRTGEPVNVHIGMAVQHTETSSLISMTERVGWSTMV